MKLSLKIFFFFSAFLIIVGSNLYALEVREKVTELDGMHTVITIKGDRQTAVMNGPISLSHEGTTLKADKGTIEFFRNPISKQIDMKSILCEGSVRYSDKAGYSGTCAEAFYDFPASEAEFSNGVKLSGNEIELQSVDMEYFQTKQEFFAHKKVTYEGMTHFMPLLVSGATASDVPFILNTEDIAINRLDGTASADGGIDFKSGDTNIRCQDVDLLFVDNEIVYIKAAGGVRFKDPDMTASADTAIYDKKTLTLTLSADKDSKDVIAVFRGQEIKGREVILNLANGREITLGKGSVNIVPRKIK